MAQRPIRYMTINLRQDRATQLHSVITETAPKSPFFCVKTSVCQWNLDSGFQSFVGFRIPWGAFPIPKPRIRDFTGKNFLDSGIRVLYHRAKNTLPYTEERRKNKMIDIHPGNLSTKRRLNTFQHSTKSIFNVLCRVGQLFAMHSFHF